MEDENKNHNNNSRVNLKLLAQEELELKIDSLLAKCRTEVDIKTTAERGAMFRKGPFQISISLAVKMKKYQDELLYCKRNPYDVLLSVCTDNGWGAPEFKAVDYTPGEGFLFSVIVNDHELISKYRDRRPLLAADLAAANFLRYLGLWVNVRNLNFFFNWEQITTQDDDKKEEVGNINGYLYFMGFHVVKTEVTGVEELPKTVLSLRPNLHLHLAKMLYVLLMSRGEKSCWLTDIDIAYFKHLFGGVEPDASYAFHNASWKSHLVCSCPKKKSKICFNHEECFLFFLLKDFLFVNKFGPANPSVFEKLKGIKTEPEETTVKETDGGNKSNVLKYEKEKLINENESADDKNILEELKMLMNERMFDNLKCVKKENEVKMIKKETEGSSKQHGRLNQNEIVNKSLCLKKAQPTSSVDFDPTETPVNLRETKFDLRSKIFGKVKTESNVKSEEVDFKVSFDITTGCSNVKSSVGSWITVADISPPCVPKSVQAAKRPSSITVVTTSKRKKKKVK